MVDVNHFVIGNPASVLVGAYGAAEGACTDIGGVDGVDIETTTERSPQESGSLLGVVISPVVSRKTQVKMVMEEATLENLALAMGMTTGAVSGGTTLKVGENYGEDKVMYINTRGPHGGTSKFTFWKCVFAGALVLKYSKKDKVTYGVTVDVLEDTTQAAGQEIYKRVDTGADLVAPTVASTDPVDAAPNVPITANMEWIMSELLAPGTVVPEHCWLMKADGTPVTCVLTWIAEDLKVRLDPAASLANATPYIGVLSTGITDVAGNHLADNSIVNFTTVA